MPIWSRRVRRLALTAALVLAGAGSPLAAADLVLDDGTTVRRWDEGAAGRYSIRRADGTWTAPRELDARLHLRRATFDPQLGAAAVDAGLSSPPGARLIIVQFHTQWLAPYGRAIAAIGGTVHQHLPATGRLVRIDPALVGDLLALPFVRWAGPYHPAYRADESMLAACDGGEFALPAQRYTIRLVAPEHDRAALADAIIALGGAVDRADAGALLMEATLTGAQLAAVLARDEVLFIDPWSPFEPDIDNGRAIGGADVLESIAGYDGDGVRGEVMDTGFNLVHVDFASRPLLLHSQVDSNAHGASTSGIIFGDGTGDPSRRGVLPAGQGIVADYGYVSVDGPPRYAHTAELVQSPWEAVFQTCSFGSALTTQYTNISAEMDQMIFDFDLTIAQSQSNANSQNSRPQAWAKNVVAVGGVDHKDTAARDDDTSSSASYGPAADGRIKPELCHFYESIGTVTCCGATSYTDGFGGTSGATPIVAGYFGLFYDLWADGVFGNEVVLGETVFNNRSHQSTAKAMIINGALPYDWTAGGPNDGLTRARQGWGVPSIEAVWNARDRMLVVDEDILLPNLGLSTHVVTVLPGEPTLRVTLTWADLPGTTSASIHRVNDLDLRVMGPDGQTYHGNVGLAAGVWSQPGGERDTVNTVENVFIAQPTPGEWTIEVIATELNDDGEPDTPALDAHFALVASGVEVVPPPLVLGLATPFPTLLPPGIDLTIDAIVADGTEVLVSGSPTLHYRTDGVASYVSTPLMPVDGEPDRYRAVVPALGCPLDPGFYLSAESTQGTVVTSPSGAPDAPFRFEVGIISAVVEHDFEGDDGWTVENENVIAGPWERGAPSGGIGAPSTDYDGSGQCWVTGLPVNTDLDGGPTRLLSPIYDLSAVAFPVLRYARVFVSVGGGDDVLTVEVSNDAGATWVPLETVIGLQNQWIVVERNLTAIIAPTDQVQVRFSVLDEGPNSLVEVALDAVRIVGGTCVDEPADLDGDGVVDFADLVEVLAAWGPCEEFCPADLDGDGEVGCLDLLLLLMELAE